MAWDTGWLRLRVFPLVVLGLRTDDVLMMMQLTRQVRVHESRGARALISSAERQNRETKVRGCSRGMGSVGKIDKQGIVLERTGGGGLRRVIKGLGGTVRTFIPRSSHPDAAPGSPPWEVYDSSPIHPRA